MTAQIIPFQTQEQRTLANAFGYFHVIKDSRARSGDSVDPKTIIPSAVYWAAADERWGPDWHDDPEIKKAIDTESTASIIDACHGRVNFERDRWDQYSQRLEWLLARWLDGKPQRLRQRKPLRPPRRRIKSGAPLAQIIPFPISGTGDSTRDARIAYAAATLLEKWGPEGAAGRKAQRERERESAAAPSPDAA